MLVAPEALERAAIARMGRDGAAYIVGGAGMERTIAANRAAFDRHRILPLPFLLAPIGVLEMAHMEADLASARAAAGKGVPFVTSSQACFPMEEITQACGEGPRWFQLY